MTNQSTIYPNLNWAQFEVCNDNKTDAFEEMCRDLFAHEFVDDSCNIHADHNNPGVEVNPVLERKRADGQPQRLISYQAKYFESAISNKKIIESLKQAVKHYAGKLDVIYLFCNKTISKESSRYKKYTDVLSQSSMKKETSLFRIYLMVKRRGFIIRNSLMHI